MPTIHQLPPSVVNKIAAGEVIERPASVVKELLENAVDAGATRIDVALAQGGTELVRIVDNGCGIEPQQLPLAVASHATSKIRDADDLFRVGTLGFRGEALASIAEVGQLVLRSRTPGSEAGAELEVIGGKVAAVTPCGAPPGTSIEVRNLFFNTPVRKKFLRNTQTELGHATEAFTRLALAHRGVHFSLRHNERVVYDLPPVESWRDRVAAIFGGELAEALLPVDSSDGAVRLAGYVAHPSQSRANNRMQYLFLNGRHIRDRALQHALGEAYRGLLLTGRYPIAFLHLSMPADLVDVNVHPTKLEVRFQDAGRVYSQLLGTLRTRFLATDLTTKVRLGGGERDAGEAPSGGPPFPAPASAGDPAAAHDDRRAAEWKEELVRWAKGQFAEQQGAEPADPPRQEGLPLQFERPASPLLQLTRLERAWPPAGGEARQAAAMPPREGERPPSGPTAQPPDAGQAAPQAGAVSRHVAAMQIHNRYLVAETREGVVVIDQHALHERILYEQLREKVLGRAIETQRLLVPEPVHLTAAESAAVLGARDHLAQLGIEVEPFGGDTVLVAAYPAMLANVAPGEILRQLIERLLDGGAAPQARDVLDDLLHMIACKAAIKAGDRLSPSEIEALVVQRHDVQDAHHCPHGRPTELVFTREELDRRFQRT
jgi:DNA mismatch repair protein MutL